MGGRRNVGSAEGVLAVGTSGIEAVAKKLRIYPNPAHSIILISSDDPAIQSIQVMDMQGKTLINYANIHDNRVQINLSSLSPGIFLVRIFFLIKKV